MIADESGYLKMKTTLFFQSLLSLGRIKYYNGTSQSMIEFALLKDLKKYNTMTGILSFVLNFLLYQVY